MFTLVNLLFNEEEIDDGEDHSGLKLFRRNLRDNNNILELPSDKFRQIFRVNKPIFQMVLEEIEPFLRTSHRRTAIPPIIKLAATMRFLAQGSYQLSVGDDFCVSLSQPAVSRVLDEVCTIIEDRLCAKWISLKMNKNEEMEAKKFFFENYRLPNVVGAIDGTHIQIIRPSENEAYYLNRKQKHSLNAMMICDNNMIIRSIDATHGGSSHDAFIWGISDERKYFENLYNNGENSIILGDSAYPLEPYLMTPYRICRDASEESFNDFHCKGRCIIERTFGLLKARFRCLISARELHYTPKKALKFVNVSCALHNMCIRYKVPQPEDDVAVSAEENNSYIPDDNTQQSTNLAKRIRDNIKLSIASFLNNGQN